MKEYWFGILFLIILASIPNQQIILTLINTSLIRTADWDSSFISTLFLVQNTFRAVTTPPLLPYMFIILYSSFILTFKRTKGRLNIPIRFALGTFTWFMLALLPNTIALITSQLKNISIYEHTTIYQALILIGILFILGMASVFITTLCGNDCYENKKETSFNSINYVFKLYLLQLIFSLIFILISTLLGVMSYSGSPHFKLIIIITLLLIYAGGFIFLMTLRAIDAGIPPYIPFVVILATALLGTGTYLGTGFFMSESLLATVPATIAALMFSILNFLYIVLIILPTKKNATENSEIEIKEVR